MVIEIEGFTRLEIKVVVEKGERAEVNPALRR
jgi:hypothetical protein